MKETSWTLYNDNAECTIKGEYFIVYNYELCIMNDELIFMSDIAIKVENLSKYYRLGVINNGTLFKDMQSWFARLFGKEDPNAKIGSTYKDSKEGFWALKDLNFEIKKGDRVGIIGHNGAGKSTLLKVLSQITTPTEGNIKINGRVASLLEVGTGFHPEMTGRENIYMNGAILGMKKSEIDKKVDQIIEFSEIGEHIDTPVKRYSSGMYVRLAFAVAAHLDSDILIADEVLAVGDAAFQKKALGKMNELSTGEGRTVLFVSHNMAQVKKLCNKGILLDHGKVLLNGNLDEVVDAYIDNPFEHLNDFDLQEQIKKLPEDKNFKLVNLKVTQNGRNVNVNVGNGSPIDIEIKYEIKHDERAFRVYFDILEKNGDILVRSFNDGQEEGVSFVKAGGYKVKTQIPANFLADKEYILRICSTVFNERYCMGNGISIPLKVENDGLYNKAYLQEPCRGKLGMIFNWETKKID